MTLSQQEKQRFLQALDSDLQFLAEVRSRLLSSELVQLPERFAQFANRVNAFIERQEEFNARQEETNARQEEFNARQEGFNARQEGFNARQEEFNARQEEFNAKQEGFNARQEEFNARQEEFNARQEGFNARQEETNATVAHRLQRITDDLGDLKGHVAGRIARETCDGIAERLGFEVVEQLNGNDLRRMVRENNLADITLGDRQSFYRADLVAKVINQAGEELFIAAEASYTADERDTHRAIRNAGFLKGITGLEALPVIASLRNDHTVQRLVDAGEVRWFQFDQRDLSPE